MAESNNDMKKHTKDREDKSVEETGTKMEYLIVIDARCPSSDGATSNSKPERPTMVFFPYKLEMEEEILKLKEELELKNFTCLMDVLPMVVGRQDEEIIDYKIFAACVTENYKPNIWPLLERLYWFEGWPVRALVPTLVRVNCQEDLAKNEKLHEKVAEIIKRRIDTPEVVERDYRKYCMGNIRDFIEGMIKEHSRCSLTPTRTVDSPISPNSKLVYISYQKDIKELVLQLKRGLESRNLTCWMDMKNTAEGDVFTEIMQQRIRECKVFVACVTQAYTESIPCQREVALASELNRNIVAIVSEEVPWPVEGPMGEHFATFRLVSVTPPTSPEIFDAIRWIMRPTT